MKMIEMLYERHSFMKKDSMKQEQLIWVVIIVVGDINHWLTCLNNDHIDALLEQTWFSLLRLQEIRLVSQVMTTTCNTKF
jgi:hypothetical protein